jgi:hypothetical protein
MKVGLSPSLNGHKALLIQDFSRRFDQPFAAPQAARPDQFCA